RGTYFMVDTLGLWLPVVDGSERVYLDDGSSESNTANTILDTTIAGVAGDFDRLYPVINYWMDYRTGAIQCMLPPGAPAVLAVAYSCPAGEREVIVRSDSVSGLELLNKYRIGAKIVPMSLSISIVDTLGLVHELSEFGLDSNSDGIVDPQHVDFDRGVLTFPDRRPFPDEVYTSGTNIFTILVSYSTTSSVYRLSHRRMVRLSERVRLDGTTLERGNDYVLDYTSGTLIMLREELIGDKSQIDVSYEYERDSDERLNMVEFKINPGSTFRANLRGIRFGDVEKNLGSSDLIQGSVEVRTKVRGFDLRIPVELAKSMGDTLTGMAQRYSVYASGRRLRASCAFGSYESDFVSFSPQEGRLGAVRKTYELIGEYYFLDWLVGAADWQHQIFVPEGVTSEPYVDNGRAGLILSKPGLPALSITAGTSRSVLDSTDERLRQISSALSYTMTREEASNLPVKSLNVNSSFVRTWWEEFHGDSSGAYGGWSFRLLSTLFSGVSFGTEYLHRAGVRDSVEGAGSYQNSRTGEIRLSCSLDRIPGLSLYAKIEREAEESPCGGGSDRRDGDLEWRDYGRFGFHPGMWFKRLSFVDFEYEISKYLSTHIRSAPGELSLEERYWYVSESILDDKTDSKTENFKGRIRPHISLLIDLGYEKTREERRILDSGNGLKRDRYDARAEYAPRYRSTITLYYDQMHDRRSPVSSGRAFSPSAWWEERWTSWMFTKTGLSYRYQDDSVGVMGSTRSHLSPWISATLRAGGLPFLGDIELTADCSVTRMDCSNLSPSEQTLYESSFQLDIKPPHLLRLKTKLDVSYGDDWGTNLLVTLSGTF
ncbi:MAG: hypothetical protein ACE5JA_07295, partial [bacterium]